MKQKDNKFIPIFITLIIFGNLIGWAYFYKDELRELLLSLSESTSASLPENYLKAQKHFNSLQEREAKYADWANKYEFRVAVFNNNVKKDNYARYVCLMLSSKFNIVITPFIKKSDAPALTVKVYDYMKMQNNVWDKIGEYDCSKEL